MLGFVNIKKRARYLRHAMATVTVMLLCSMTAMTQRLPVKNYTVETGLPNAQNTRVFQDSRGFIWFLSSSGLIRYDGEDYLIYNKQDGFPSNVAVSMAEDSAGNLWALMSNGLSVFQVSVDGQIIRHEKLDHRNGLPYDEYTAMLLDDGPSVWIGTRNNGLAHFWYEESGGRVAVGRKNFITTGNGLTSQTIHNVFRDNKNNYWIATDRGISVIRILNAEKFVYRIQPLTVRNGLGSDYVSRIIQDRSDVIWAGTRKGLSRLIDALESPNPVKFKNYGKTHRLVNERINDISLDRVGHIWLVTPEGLSKFFLPDRKQGLMRDYIPAVTNYDTRHGFIENGFLSLYVDRQNIIWLPTTGGQISKLTSERFQSFTMDEGLPHPNIGPLFQDRGGIIYAGCGNRLIVIRAESAENGARETFIRTAAIPPSIGGVQDITADEAGNVWAATENILYRVKDQFATPAGSFPELKNRNIRRLLFDRHNQKWIGTSSGLIRERKNSVRLFTRADGLTNESVRAIALDRYQRLWIGTQDGLCYLDENDLAQANPKIHALDHPDLNGKFIIQIFEDRLSDLWIGTDGGLIRLMRNNTDAVQKVVPVDLNAAGFMNQSVISILQDPTGMLWILTRKGVHIFNPENASVRRIWTKKDGLAGNEGLSGKGLMRDRSGMIWMGLSSGLTRYLPKVDFDVDAPPVIHIKKIFANDERQPKHTALTLPYRTKQISVEYTALDFQSEESVQYEIMLEGHDQTWNEPTHQRKMRFSNLGSGNYIFKIRLFDPSQPGASAVQYNLPLRIETHPLRQWWFYAIAGILMVGIVYAAYQRRMITVKRRNEELEHKIHLRTQEIRNQNEQIRKQQAILEQQKKQLEFTIKELTLTQNDLIHSKKMASLIQIVAGIAHELNNPLSNVYGNINLLKDYLADLRKLLDAYQERYRTVDESGNPEITRLNSGIEAIKRQMDYDFVIEDIDEITKSIVNGANRLIRIVENLRHFSRLDESQIKEFDVNDSLKNVVELFINQYRFSLRIETQYQDIPTITGYPQELNQALMQILLNAAQAILSYKEITEEQPRETAVPEKGCISITTQLVFLEKPALVLDLTLKGENGDVIHDRQPAIQIRIRDNGIGIRDEHKEKIFDPFFTTRKIGEGTGLGLSVAYSIVEKHNGKIFFNSQYMEGSEFIIELPVKNSMQVLS